MPFNQPLSLIQKYRLFMNVPGAKIGFYVFVIGLFLLVVLGYNAPNTFDEKPITLLVLALPLLGIVLMYPAIKALRRMIVAIENGVFIEGQLLSETGTSTRIGGRPLVKLKLGYELYSQLYTCEKRIVDPSKNVKHHWLMVDAENPKNVVYVETLPTDLKRKLINANELYLKTQNTK